MELGRVDMDAVGCITDGETPGTLCFEETIWARYGPLGSGKKRCCGLGTRFKHVEVL